MYSPHQRDDRPAKCACLGYEMAMDQTKGQPHKTWSSTVVYPPPLSSTPGMRRSLATRLPSEGAPWDGGVANGTVTVRAHWTAQESDGHN